MVSRNHLGTLFLLASLPACTILDSEQRQLEVQVGTQSGSPGDFGGDPLPSLGLAVKSDQDELGIQSVFGVQFSSGTDKDVQVSGTSVETELETWSAYAGIRGWPLNWEGSWSPFMGLGFAYLDLGADSILPSAGDQDLGYYAELGIEVGALSLTWRRLEDLGLDLGTMGQRDVALNQLLLGWTTGF